MYSSINLIQQVAKFILWKPGIEQTSEDFSEKISSSISTKPGHKFKL